MKTLGDAIDGGKIVVLTEDEFRVFLHLIAMVEDKSLDRLRAERGFRMDSDIEAALVAVIEFAVNQTTITEAIKQLEVVKNLWFSETKKAS